MKAPALSDRMEYEKKLTRYEGDGTDFACQLWRSSLYGVEL